MCPFQPMSVIIARSARFTHYVEGYTYVAELFIDGVTLIKTEHMSFVVRWI